MISTAYASEAAHAAASSPLENPHTWVYLAFVLVVGFAFKPVFNAIGAGLDGRAAKIKARLDEAHKLREDAQELLASVRGADGHEFSDGVLTLFADDAEEVLRSLDHGRFPTDSAVVRRATLEDVFLHLTGRSLRE